MDNGIENPWDSVLADTITYVGIKFHLQLGSCSTSPSHFGQVKVVLSPTPFIPLLNLFFISFALHFLFSFSFHLLVPLIDPYEILVG